MQHHYVRTNPSLLVLVLLLSEELDSHAFVYVVATSTTSIAALACVAD